MFYWKYGFNLKKTIRGTQAAGHDLSAPDLFTGNTSRLRCCVAAAAHVGINGQ